MAQNVRPKEHVGTGKLEKVAGFVTKKTRNGREIPNLILSERPEREPPRSGQQDKDISYMWGISKNQSLP